ncbi:MAG: PepSY domain-containing protein [Thaumarchaeota archaeon]|nr:PepSY domain-containing protein [Nitrososphaerota archaeon]
MNTNDIFVHKKLLTIILGVAILATVGVSAASAQVQGTQNQKPQIQGSINLEQTIMSNVKVSFSTASDTAASAVSGKVIDGSLTVMQGYIVYSFKVIDDKNMVYSVIVDPSTGSVLYQSQGHQFGMGGFGMGGARGMNKPMDSHSWNSNPQSGNAPSTVPSGSQS